MKEPIVIEQESDFKNVDFTLVIDKNESGTVFINQKEDDILIYPTSIPAVISALYEVGGQDGDSKLELVNRILERHKLEYANRNVEELLKDYIVIKKPA